MIRLIFILTLILLILWMGKSILKDLRKLKEGRRPDKHAKTSSSSTPVADKLVKDPVCGVYCPKSKAHTVLWKGKVFYFCSERCRQKFLEQLSSSSSE